MRSGPTITSESRSIRASLSRVFARCCVAAGTTVPHESETGRYLFEGFIADPFARTVTDPDGGEVELTGAEFDLLVTFLDRPGRVLSRDQLLDLTHGRDGDVLDRSIDVLISRLRRKLSDGGATQIFKTVRNGGYQLAAKVTRLDEQK